MLTQEHLTAKKLAAALASGSGLRAKQPVLKPTLCDDFIAFFLTTGIASLRELRECYSYRDAFMLIEVYRVNAQNRRNADLAARQTAELRRMMYGKK